MTSMKRYWHIYVGVILLLILTWSVSAQEQDTLSRHSEMKTLRKQLRSIQKRVSLSGSPEVIHDLYELQASVDTAYKEIHREILISLGLVLSRDGNYSDALQHYLDVLPMVGKDAKSDINYIHISMRVAKCFLYLGNDMSALYYLEEALKRADQSSNFRVKFNAYRLAGIVQQEIDQNRALESFEKAESYESDKLNGALRLGCCAQKILTLLDLDRLSEARDQLKKCQPLLEKVKKGQQVILYQLGEIDYLLRTKQLSLAEKKANQLQDNMPFMHRRHYYGLMNQLYVQKEKYEKAYEYLLRENVLSDSIYQLRKNQIVFDLEKKYQTANKQKIIQELELSNEVNRLKIQRRNRWLIFAGILILATVSFLIFIAHLNRKLKKSYLDIEEKNKIISKALEEKAYLVKEVHHRVKNNLQVISSLFSLQASFTKDSKSLEAINEGRDRIRSMVLLHQQLYNEDHLMDIHVKPYLERMCGNLFAAHETNVIIEHTLDIEDLSMELDQVTSIGLIVNELVTNCLKHAFEGRDAGHVKVQLFSVGERAHLVVSDDGIGFSQSKQILENPETFGYHMIRAFLRKIDGKLSIENENGSKVIIDLSKKL